MEQHILQAFAHWVFKDHDYTTTCDGCIDAAAWLMVVGYNGEKSHPLSH